MKPFDFDALLDKALQEQAEAQPGIEQRILARLGEKKARNRRRLWTLGLSGASVAACLVLVAIAHHPRPSQGPGSLSPATPFASLPGSKKLGSKDTPQTELALKAHSGMPVSASTYSQRSPVKRAAVRIHNKTGTATRQMPKLDTFPAVTQQSGNLLLKSPQVIQALQELKAEQQQPLEISAIEIQPL